MSDRLTEMSVLVVEDNIPLLEITRSLLFSFGMGAVHSAHNGVDGFEIFCAKRPHIVIADWMMTPMDGITLTRTIRTDPRSPNLYVPIILMTSFSEKKRVFEARDAGVTEFLVKPFNGQDLYKRLIQVIERPRKFVKTEEFFGPDRRRKADPEYKGPPRRENERPARKWTALSDDMSDWLVSDSDEDRD